MIPAGISILEGPEAPLLADRTTLRLGGRVLAEIVLGDLEAATLLPDIAQRLGGKLVCLGAGSNILAADSDLPLVVVRNALEPAIEVLVDDGKTAIVRAAASVKLPVLLGRLAGMDLGGLEGLSGIPGTVGGAVAMNAGSYGQSVADALVAVRVITGAGTVRTVSRNVIDFAYRHMAVPGCDEWYMVTAAEFSLTRKEPGTVAALGREHMARKKETQPVTAASAGCVFKNPEGAESAGKLLDAAGFKGKRLGGMAFSAMHANFMVNEGGGTSAEAFELLAMAQDAVRASSGISLEPEVKIWA